MSKSNVIVLSVVQQGLGFSEAAQQFGVSKRCFNKLLAKYHSDGLKADQPLSKKPKTSPKRTPQAMWDRIVKLRLATEAGFDAGPASIAARLRMAEKKSPAISTIRRILDKQQLIVLQPKKSHGPAA